jgi:hypothetical protein
VGKGIKRKNQRDSGTRRTQPNVADFEEGDTSQGMQGPLEARKGKESNSAPELPAGTKTCGHLDLSPVRLLSTF